ncbi:hypothetical protein [Streptomyces sp. NPDC101206]|uniref:hypothetical protein n=1 Tax=Streptomyces sp. NPDC101206 TaxID=3366128 RepID=UPI003808896C
MPLPTSIPTVTVHGTYLGPDARPLAGTVTFSAPSMLTFPDADLFLAGPVVAVLDENGRFEVKLPATDAPNMDPTKWSYVVKENLSGVIGGRVFSLLLPKAKPDVDLADLAPSDPQTPNYVPVAGSQILTGSAAPTSALGRDGDFYTQYDTRTLLGITHTTVTMWTRSGAAWAKVGGDVRGSQWYVNTTTTPSTDAKPGDMLLRSDTGDIWQRTGSGWGSSIGNLKGPKGDQGAPGSKVYAFASGAEASGVGVPDDFAVRTDTGAVYTYVAGTGWTVKGNIKGPKGDTGATGPQGPKGDPGTGNVDTVNGKVGPAVVLNAADVGALATTARGAVNGVASLDASGKVPAAQLPSVGAGTVKSVNGKAPDGTGDVTLAATDVGAVANTVPVTLKADATSADPLKVQNDASADLFAVRKSGSAIMPLGNLYVNKNLRVGGTAGASGIGSTVNGVLAIDAGTGPSAVNANGINMWAAGGNLMVQEPTGRTFTVGGTDRNTWTPQALGFQAWSVDPAAVANPTGTPKAVVVGRIYFCGMNITETTQVNAVAIMARGWAGSAAVPAARFYAGIYNESGSRVATSGVVSNLPEAGQITGTAPGAKTNHVGAVPVPLSATVTLQPGRYWAAFLMSAGAATDMYYFHIQNEAPSNPGNFFLGTAFQRHWCIASGQTSLPTTVNQATGEVGLDPAIMALALV